MHLKPIVLVLGLSLPFAALAQQVPAIDHSKPHLSKTTYSAPKTYGPLPVLSEDRLKLNMQQQQAVNLSNQWKNNPEMPSLGEEGLVKFNFGSSLPTVVCAPLYACDVALQAGEIVTQVDVGDALRWKVTPASSGNGETAVTHLVLKPADVGLSTNLLIHTDHRTYNIQLVSKKESWMPNVAFTYPDDTQAQWTAYQKQHAAQAQSRVVLAPSPAANLNFNYRLKGNNVPWMPIRVYADQSKTYIQFPPNAKNRDIPALVVLGDSQQAQLVNYRMVDDRFVVDQVIERAALIWGVGKRQQRIEIIKEGQE